MSFFWAVLFSAFPALVFSNGSRCIINETSSSQSGSPSLKSLQCYNDYESYVQCEWTEHGNTTLQLWFKDNEKRKLCVRYHTKDARDHRTVQCKYEAKLFSIGAGHTVFFLKNEMPTFCPSGPLDLSQHMRARPPVNLSTHGSADGGRWISWAGPYPSSSSLDKHITYQLSYRTRSQDTWTSVDVKNISVKIDKRHLLPGQWYEVRVRARASVGQWSHWSPVVTWHSEKDPGQSPSLHCVLNGEEEVMCSWEVSREVDYFITYQLACRHNRSAPSERCCVNSTVSADLTGAVLRYSCSLIVADPAHLLIELLPTHNAKSFAVDKHIRPNPPEQVKMTQKDINWVVEWIPPKTAPTLRLYYQVLYYSIQDPGSSVLLNISEGSTSLNILGASLIPSKHYQVKVRSILVPQGYKGIPSEWTVPVDWTSLEATWSPTSLIYFTISVLVAAVFLTLYCTIPACQRRAILWVDSVPSPGKSKILCEIKSAGSQCVTVSKVLRLDSALTCSSDTLLWPTKDTEHCLEQDEGCWGSEDVTSPNEEVNCCDTSSMSFSGPYIFCQSSETSHTSGDIKCEEKDKTHETDDTASVSPVTFTPYGGNYVCLPSHSVSRSTQDLVSCSAADTNPCRHDGAEQDLQCPDEMDVQPDVSEPSSSHQPANTSGLFTAWPEESSFPSSGYFHLPEAFMRAEK